MADIDNPLKRKHQVSFADDAAHEAPAAAGLIGGIHPDRLAVLQEVTNEPEAARAAKKQKVKTENQKRYLKKKVNKRKKILKAAKAAAPKSSKDAPLVSPEAQDGSVQTELPTVKSTPAVPVATLALQALVAAVDPTEETAEQARERKRLEKKAKREVRRAQEAIEAAKEAERAKAQEEKEKREEEKAEKRAKKAAEKKAVRVEEGADALVVSEGQDQVDEEQQDVDMDAGPEAGPSSSRSMSPGGSVASDDQGITPFPLPTGPAKPDSTLLNAQGMPTALKDATLVDEALRIGLTDLKVLGRSRKGKEREVLDVGLDVGILEKLRKIGIEDFFAVQAALLPELANLPLTPLPQEFLHDYLVSAPTGSGKTLAYGIPLIKILSKRIVTRLRALIILPTRELVGQVRETLMQLAKGTGLKIGVATGQQSFPQEQAALIDNLTDDLLGGSSKVDILIATPGRLMDHLQGTKNFSLQHLRFLVVDEADRLLTQSFQGWLAEVLEHLQPKRPEGSVKQDIVASSWYPELYMGGRLWEGAVPMDHTCQKLLFSATLTRDPSKIAALQLRNPRYLIVRSETEGAAVGAGDLTGQQFAIPAGLSEHMIIMPPELKPLNLLYLLHTASYDVRSALCFTKSVDSAERLLRLLSFFEDAFIGSTRKIVVRGYTSDLGTGERNKLMSEFKDGKIDLLVCSDLIARGIDLPSVSHVISYDVPVDMRKYVHRVGRTARAGREGVAWSLVEKQEAHHFKEMLSTANHLQKVKKVKLKDDDFAPYQESYKIALGRLRDSYAKA